MLYYIAWLLAAIQPGCRDIELQFKAGRRPGVVYLKDSLLLSNQSL